MGLLDSLKSTFNSSGEASVPPAASFATREGVIYAPVNGVLVNLNEIPDETIASGMLGQGYGIEPITGTIYAPANGRIGATTVTNHSIGMITEDGIRVFIHVGLGTVQMNGKGFARFVEMGDVVKAGQPLISFDRDAIKAAGHEDIVTVIISELDRLKSIDHVGESGTLIGGNPLVKLGDPLLVAMASHAGGNQVQNWLNTSLYSTDGLTIVLDNLPDGPTKQYAIRVKRDFAIYRRLYYDALEDDA